MPFLLPQSTNDIHGFETTKRKQLSYISLKVSLDEYQRSLLQGNRKVLAQSKQNRVSLKCPVLITCMTDGDTDKRTVGSVRF